MAFHRLRGLVASFELFTSKAFKLDPSENEFTMSSWKSLAWVLSEVPQGNTYLFALFAVEATICSTSSSILVLFFGLRVLISCLPILLDGTDNYDDGSSGMRPKKNVRRERDDKVHDSIIEERIQRERPCRTLFIRNIKASHLRCAGLVCKIH